MLYSPITMNLAKLSHFDTVATNWENIPPPGGKPSTRINRDVRPLKPRLARKCFCFQGTAALEGRIEFRSAIRIQKGRAMQKFIAEPSFWEILPEASIGIMVVRAMKPPTKYPAKTRQPLREHPQ